MLSDLIKFWFTIKPAGNICNSMFFERVSSGEMPVGILSSGKRETNYNPCTAARHSENIRASHYSSCSLNTLPPKAKSCPQPPQKQNSNHNPQEIKASLSLHKQNKGFFQPHNMYFLSSKLRSRRGTRKQD